VAHVVFLRAANVGGRNVCRPAELAKRLAHLEVTSLGAAGTFLVRGRATPATIRREILAGLTFAPEIVIRPAEEVVALVKRTPFAGVRFTKDLRGWVAILAATPKGRPGLPVLVPGGKGWSVRVDQLEGAFTLGVWRRQPKSPFPNQVVEKAFGVPATTRWWETIEALAALVHS
jgi:uncharacterized protein (DUF1697 family)